MNYLFGDSTFKSKGFNRIVKKESVEGFWSSLFSLNMFSYGKICALLAGIYGATRVYRFIQFLRNRAKINRYLKEMKYHTKTPAVLITGCDSGLGLSLCIRLVDKGFKVYGGLLDYDNRCHLKEPIRSETYFKWEYFIYPRPDLCIFKLDITKPLEVQEALDKVSRGLKKRNEKLLALVNNAGVMAMGEFEWATESLIDYQLDVNLKGTMRMTQAFLPLLREHGGRVINITSHCSKAGLPGLSVYCASKAGLDAWSDSLRAEMRKFNVQVVKFVPGNLSCSSWILKKQAQHWEEMLKGLDSEKENFYGEYIKSWTEYTSKIPQPVRDSLIKDERIYERFLDALLDVEPKNEYVVSNNRYDFYHFLFRMTQNYPRIRDEMVLRFVSMPRWK